MTVFNEYAKYYDLLYHDKNYQTEAKYIDNLIQQYSPNSKKILELGSGTGSHALHLCAKGYNIYGIDLSNEMIKIAKSKKISNAFFQIADARKFNLNKKFDIVIALFHVISYQNTDKEIDSMLQSVASHLNTGGFFIFDYWYKPAVLNQLPVYREKSMENKFLKILRKATPTHHKNKDLVIVNYDINILNKAKKQLSNIQESHSMRYFTVDDIKTYLNNNNFELLKSEEWLSKLNIGKNSWGVCSIAQKK